MMSASPNSRAVPRLEPRSARPDPELEAWTEHYQQQTHGESEIADPQPASRDSFVTTDTASRVLPHDLDAEAAVLSAVLNDAAALPAVLELLKPDQFYSEANRRIYEATMAVHAAGQPVDIVTAASRLRDTERLVQVGGTPYLAQLVDAVPSVANVSAYAAIIRDKWRLRKLITTCTQLAASSYDTTDNADEWIARARSQIEQVGRSPASRFERVGASDIFASLPPIPWLVRDLDMCPGPPCMIAGDGFTRKTVACQSMAVSIATGRSIWGWFRCQQGRVLHIDHEQGSRLTLERYQRLCVGLGVTQKDVAGNLDVVVFPDTYLDSPGAQDVYARETEGYALVIIDSFRAAAPSVDENDSTVRRLLDLLMRVSEKTGVVPLVIHHARKPQRDAAGGAKSSVRGSGAINQALSSLLVFEADEGEPTLVHHVKARTSGVCAEPFYLETSDVQVGNDPIAGLTVAYRTVQQIQGATPTPSQAFEQKTRAVFDFIATQPGPVRGASRIAEALGIRKSTVIEIVAELLEQGRIRNNSADPKHPSYHVGSRSGPL